LEWTRARYCTILLAPEEKYALQGPTKLKDAVVYVVDDDELVCRALSRLFRSVGLEAKTFPSAPAFIDYTPPDRPACLVLDVRLPGLSGLDLQSALGQARRDIPIVFITGHGSVPTSVRAMKGGAVDFLEKPFNDQELLDCVQRALDLNREQRANLAESVELRRRLETLTPREREVLKLVVAGKLNKQIADNLGNAEKTIKVHRGRVMQKMRADSVADLVRMTEKLGL
jgi:FixJ family two-component response regulator